MKCDMHLFNTEFQSALKFQNTVLWAEVYYMFLWAEVYYMFIHVIYPGNVY